MTTELVMNHATLRHQMGMAEFLDASVRRGLRAVSIWGDEIDRLGESRAKAALKASGLKVSGYNRAGPFVEGTRHPAGLFDIARREIDRAADFGADHIVICSGGLPPGSKDLAAARARFAEQMRRLRDYAKGSGLVLALEPQHPMIAGDRSILVQLSAANDLCDQLGEGFGIVIDTYHLWWDAALAAEIARAGAAGRITAFQVSDWLVPTNHLHRDRGMMGDGVIDLAGIWGMVWNAGYIGAIEIELFSDRWWAEEPEMVYDLCLSRCRQIFIDGPVADREAQPHGQRVTI